MKYTLFTFFVGTLILFSACKKETIEEEPQIIDNGGLEAPKLVFKIKLDPNQTRLDNFGNPAVLPSNHAAQSPTFNSISAHYIELAPTSLTQLGEGEIVYKGIETTDGGTNAVKFDEAKVVGNNEVLVSVPLTDITAGTYNWARVSLTYQNFDINFKASGMDATGTLASFVGFNTYISSHLIKTETESINANKTQGYWAFETHPNLIFTSPIVTNGQTEGTTVVNPLSATSPIPPGSCVVTGEFENGFTITGNETEDITVELSFSTNQSFEWKDELMNGIYEPLEGDTVVDMGIRGLIPSIIP